MLGAMPVRAWHGPRGPGSDPRSFSPFECPVRTRSVHKKALRVSRTASIIDRSYGTRSPSRGRPSEWAIRPIAGNHLRRSITTRMVVASGAFALLIGAVFVLLVFAIREQRDSAKR